MIEPKAIEVNGTWWRIRYVLNPDSIRLNGIVELIKQMNLCGETTDFDPTGLDVGVCGYPRKGDGSPHDGYCAPEMFARRNRFHVQLGIVRDL